MENKIDLIGVKNIVDSFAADNVALMGKTDIIIGISRGGLLPAALLAGRVDKPLVAVYIDKYDKIYFDRPDWIRGKNILVVDDIIRSGKTLRLVNEHLEKNSSPASISFFTLFRVLPLARKEFLINSFSRDSGCDIVFPWDN